MSPSNPSLRLSMISEQIKQSTPALQNRDSQSPSTRSITTTTNTTTTMSRPTLLIPGPIEFDDAVLQAMSHHSESHTAPGFISVFGDTLTQLRQLFQTTSPASQPIVVSGSGTLGWDLVAANLSEAGDNALVLHTGYFANSFADCLETYGANVTQLKAPIGSRPQLPEIEKALKEKKYKLVTVTHVDTSTGVLSDLKGLSALIQRVSPDTLLVVDGVCSVGCEEVLFDDWNLDVVLTGSQKGLGCPAGLSISMYSGRAIEVFKARKSPPASYFASLKNWLPIMQNYEAKKPSYFATPSPQLIHALHTSLTQILSKPLSARFAAQKAASARVKAAVADLGLKQIAADPADQANGMTTIYLPEGVAVPTILPVLLKKGVIFAGGLHKEIASKYIRVGHMGVSVSDEGRGDVEKAIRALGEALEECGYKKA
ncbi:hypothetical protein V500_10289 [Pseudogymnoascus sp. VKM F-4518 (FW-2643)]|nr:hypothetical protein V500_10289 [Pseudogymnoascus sp. VKM F-4518 (FW-2643)]